MQENNKVTVGNHITFHPFGPIGKCINCGDRAFSEDENKNKFCQACIQEQNYDDLENKRITRTSI